MIQVQEIMSRDVFSLKQASDLPAATFELLAELVSGAPVVDDQGKLLGVVSQTDLLKASSEGVATRRVADVMTTEVVTVRPEAPAEEVIAALLTHHVHRVVVVDDAGVVVGIVTAMDVLQAISKHFRELSPEQRMKTNGWYAWGARDAA